MLPYVEADRRVPASTRSISPCGPSGGPQSGARATPASPGAGSHRSASSGEADPLEGSPGAPPATIAGAASATSAIGQAGTERRRMASYFPVRWWISWSFSGVYLVIRIAWAPGRCDGGRSATAAFSSGASRIAYPLW